MNYCFPFTFFFISINRPSMKKDRLDKSSKNDRSKAPNWLFKSPIWKGRLSMFFGRKNGEVDRATADTCDDRITRKWSVLRYVFLTSRTACRKKSVISACNGVDKLRARSPRLHPEEWAPKALRGHAFVTAGVPRRSLAGYFQLEVRLHGGCEQEKKKSTPTSAGKNSRWQMSSPCH